MGSSWKKQGRERLVTRLRVDSGQLHCLRSQSAAAHTESAKSQQVQAEPAVGNHQATGEENDEEAEEAQRRETGRDAAVVARVGDGRGEDSCKGGSRTTYGPGILKKLFG